jgi:hypothetical protein
MRTGYQLAIGAAAITALAAILVTVAEATAPSREATAYGEIRVPGRGPVELPEGEVIIFYGESKGEDSPLTTPPGLQVSVRSLDGNLLGSVPSGFGQFDDGDYVRRSVGRLDVPESGTYRASAAAAIAGAIQPVVSFGRNGTQSFAYALLVLAGGALLALILAAGTWIRARIETRWG